ncbi:MAG: hypothetical protein JXX28_07135 [Deltaproteobacteria bacterium]|nr:hypothetical protein [Deltaproteobacteria bacterium]
MTVRFNDAARTLSLSVHDLADDEGFSGSIHRGQLVSGPARLAVGRVAHQDFQHRRGDEDGSFRAEVALERETSVMGWTVRVHGRADGLSEEGGRTVIEEVKTTQLSAERLYDTALERWPAYRRQLEVYLWMADGGVGRSPVGRLIFVSLVDASQHSLGLALDLESVEAWIEIRLAWLIGRRERRLSWLAHRRLLSVPAPFPGWRGGQEEISAAVRDGVRGGISVLAEAPTGLGKTAAVLFGALQAALPTDKQLFWSTSRNTQHAGVEATLARFQERGLALRYAVIQGRDRLCLLDEVRCHPSVCPYARDYYDKLRAGVMEEALAHGRLGIRALKRLGRAHEVCPYQLALDASAEVDVVVGDLNYAFDPEVMLRRHFGEDAGSWIVVADEAHQVVDRVREALSPALLESQVSRALAGAARPRALARAAESVLTLLRESEEGGARRDSAQVVKVSVARWVRLAAHLDGLMVDFAPQLMEPGDAWLELAWGVARWVRRLQAAGEETVVLAERAPERAGLQLVCLDPSVWLRGLIGRLGGFVGASATLSPSRFYLDLLGLDPERTHHLQVSSPFPAARRPVFLAPEVSTAWRDRIADAPRTAALIQALIEATPGNTAVFFSSFAMLRDLTERLELGERELLLQRQGMSESTRTRTLKLLSEGGPKVLAAVLGGVFAEGIDLPPGALSAVLVVGPALPPVGLERELLQRYYQERYGAGFRYASLVPGMTRVIQAAGRLVRRPEDLGVVVLIGRRFRWQEYAGLLPESWATSAPEAPVEAVRAFWEGV